MRKNDFHEDIVDDPQLTFSTKISTEDLNDRLTALCGQPRGATILLKDRYGAQVVVSPAMRTNTLHDAFIVEMQADRLSEYSRSLTLQIFILSVSALRKRAKQGRQGMRTGKKVPDT
ncbi:hypothetical protein E2C01_003280 [Portunus trituberculatus]|uniref:Uncharacterized protein n=1 Tax=Portunus trituberculatus TaxID=210409 RepID=A0A5B7CPD4_PORTR|nr:hypothetical protein [Portunus trituberculatus]